MNRRGFFGQVLAAVGLASVAPTTLDLHADAPKADAFPGEFALPRFARAALESLRLQLPLKTYTLVPFEIVGRRGIDLQHTLHLEEWRLVESKAQTIALDKAMRDLARRIGEVERFGVLRSPKGLDNVVVVTDRRYGLSMRVAHDPRRGTLRIDVVVG